MCKQDLIWEASCQTHRNGERSDDTTLSARCNERSDIVSREWPNFVGEKRRKRKIHTLYLNLNRSTFIKGMSKTDRLNSTQIIFLHRKKRTTGPSKEKKA